MLLSDKEVFAMTLKERAREAAVKYGTCKLGCTCKGKHLNAYKKQGFEKGAEWGYRQAIEALRSKDAKAFWKRVLA